MPPPHSKCRNCTYPLSSVIRNQVPDDLVNWSSVAVNYKPIHYVAESVNCKPVWADPDYSDNKIIQLISKKELAAPLWNKHDGTINRKSFTGPYNIQDNVPFNPMGRTGIFGRGLLGRWGPNHAADPIVSRWKRDSDGNVIKHSKSSLAILQFVCILRGDGGGWAIPGGMVDAGEEVSLTLKREFKEEAMSYIDKKEGESNSELNKRKEDIDKTVEQLFNNGIQIYKGYVDDPRNTDNAWMETIAMNFHDDTGKSVGKFHLHAGDDASGVKWMDISSDLKLYASHEHFIKKTATLHNAHW